jgi:hypothetical protein
MAGKTKQKWMQPTEEEKEQRLVEKGKKIRRRLRRILSRDDVRFWTFTFYEDIPDSEKSMFWNKFITRVRKDYNEVFYIKAAEIHPSNGRIHFHVIFDRWMEWEVVQGFWEASGCGKVVDVKFRKGAKAAYYMSKYVTKALRDGLGCRAMTCSRKFCLHVGDWSKWCLKMVLEGDFDYFCALVWGRISFRPVLNKVSSSGGKWERFWQVLDVLWEYGMRKERRFLIYGI